MGPLPTHRTVALKSCFEFIGAEAGREDASSIAQASTIKVDCFNKLMEKMGFGDTVKHPIQ